MKWNKLSTSFDRFWRSWICHSTRLQRFSRYAAIPTSAVLANLRRFQIVRMSWHRTTQVRGLTNANMLGASCKSMARPCPHPLALFSLCPFEGNEQAEHIVSHSNNDHNILTLSNGTLALNVGFHLYGKSSKTLAILGQGINANIYVKGSGIARV